MLITEAGYRSAYETGYARTLHFLLARRLPRGDAEDIAQEAWMRGWEKRETLREPGSLLGWINAIALNILRSRHRREQRLTLPLDRDLSVEPRDVCCRVDAGRSLLRCSPEERSLLGRLYVCGYTSEETGRRMGLSPGAVRVRVCRAKRRLRQWLGRRPRSVPGDDRKAA